MTTRTQQNEEFKKEVSEGKHPDWVINSNGELQFIGEMPASWDENDRYLANHDFLKEEKK